MPTYLEVGNYEDAEKLLQYYDGEIAANFLFNKALLYYFKDGITAETKTLLNEAMEQNPYVLDYLTGKKSIPKRAFPYVDIGDDTEAIVYTQEHVDLWRKAKGRKPST